MTTNPPLFDLSLLGEMARKASLAKPSGHPYRLIVETSCSRCGAVHAEDQGIMEEIREGHSRRSPDQAQSPTDRRVIRSSIMTCPSCDPHAALKQRLSAMIQADRGSPSLPQSLMDAIGEYLGLEIDWGNV